LDLIGAYIQNIPLLEHPTLPACGAEQSQSREQSLTSNFMLEAGSTTITIEKKLLVKPGKVNCIIRGDKNGYQLTISDLDVLFQYIYPFFKDLHFYTRKGVDFKI
jgi:hypothetical protein